MASELLVNKAAEELGEFVDHIVPDAVLTFFGKKKVTDLNVEAAKMNLQLYGVSSDNVDSKVLADIQEIMEAKYAAIVGTLVNDVVAAAARKGKDPRKAVRNRLANSEFAADSALGKMMDKITLGESIVFGTPLHESRTMGSVTARGTASTFTYRLTTDTAPISVNGKLHRDGRKFVNDLASKAAKNRNEISTNRELKYYLKHDELSKNIEDFRDQIEEEKEKIRKSVSRQSGSAIRQDVVNRNKGRPMSPQMLNMEVARRIDALANERIRRELGQDEARLKAMEQNFERALRHHTAAEDEALEAIDSELAGYADAKSRMIQSYDVPASITTRVSIMPVEAHKLVETIGSTRDRSVLFNYIRLRAGIGSFWKDFITNMKEIDKAVERNTSMNLEDRILASMIRKGGFLTPELLSSIGEAKYYILVLDKTDIDAMKDNYGFDVRKANNLRMLFDKFNILSLVVVDQIKKDLIMYDSNDPVKYYVVNYSKNTDRDQMFNMFASLTRNG